MNKIFVFLAGKVDTSVGKSFDLLEIGTLGTNDETTRVGRYSNFDSTLFTQQMNILFVELKLSFNLP